jgi:hypothetical protein
MLLAQASPAQTVPTLYLLQPPAPSHAPFVPHVAAPWSLHIFRTSAVPAGMGVHAPSEPASAQLLHAPPQAWSQQTPSTQKPDAHSVPSPQAPPGCFRPQLPLTHAIPGAQSALVVQVVLHAPCAHANGAQSVTPGGWHMPAPSQTPAVLSRVPAHDGCTHSVSALYLLQPPNPSQVPVSPQLVEPLSLQTLRASGTPAASGRQMPSLPTIPHDTHAPVHATAQQKPSTQKFDAQSALAPHF